MVYLSPLFSLSQPLWTWLLDSISKFKYVPESFFNEYVLNLALNQRKTIVHVLMQIHIRDSPNGGGNTRGTDSSPWTKNLAYLPSLFSLYPLYYLYPKNRHNFPRPEYMQANIYIHIYIYIYIIYMLLHIYYIYIYIYTHYIYHKNSAQKDTIFACHGRGITLWFSWTKFWFVIIFSSYSGLFQSLK